MISFILSFFPKTGPYFVKKSRLKELKNLSNDWVMSGVNVKNAVSIMKDFTRALDEMNIKDDQMVWTTSGYRSADDIVKSYIGDDTAEKLMNISKECVTYEIVEELQLDDVKKILLEWDGDSVDEAYSVLKCYVKAVREYDRDLIFFSTAEEFVEYYLGEELYERLGTMIRFFEKLEDLKRNLNRTF